MKTELLYDAMSIDGLVRLFENRFRGDDLKGSKVLAVLTVDEADKLVKSISAAIHEAHKHPFKPGRNQ